METKVYSTTKAILDNCIIAEGPHAVDLRNLTEDALDFYSYCLYSGAQITFQRVTVEVDIEQQREWRYGFDGNKRDVVTRKIETVQSEETLIIRKYKGEWKYRPAK
jgi:hypothetical protein